MATYAPLFAHIDGWQWRPDMIWYDNLRSFKSCSYYVQQMFSRNKGSNVLSLTMNGKPVAGNNDQDGLFASAVFDTTAKAVIVKIVNTGDKAQDVKLNFEGMSGPHPAELTTFHASDLVGENTLDEPEKYVPQTSSVTLDASNCNISVPAKTFVMYKIQ
jgi:alpha-L-arabinofuranosidase